MAKQTASGAKSSASRSNSGKSAAKSTAKSGSAKNSKTAQSRRQQADARIVDATMRRDILGVVLVVLAVALFVGAVVPTTGVITQFIHSALHLSLGVGAYLLPVALCVMGVCFLVRFSEYRIPTRVVIGVALILLAILVICALCTPGTGEGDLSHLFDEAELTKRGGYLGAGIAWVFCELLGKIVSIIVMVGVMVVALVIIGFSVSALVERIKAARTRHAENRIRNAQPTPLREDYRDARVQRSNSKGKDAYPTSEYETPSPYASTDDSLRETEALSTKLINRLKGSDARETQPLSGTYTQHLQSTSYDAPRTSSASAAVSASARGAQGAAKTGYLPPAAPLPRPGYDSIDARTSDDVSGAQAQTMTRKLSRKSATKAADAKTASKPSTAAANASEAGMSAKLSSAAEATVGEYTLPSMSLLAESKAGKHGSIANYQAQQTAQLLQSTLADFNVNIEVVGWVAGPTVTLYKLALPAGMKVATIANLSVDLSRALMVDGIRIYSPVQGTPFVGIEVPNREKETVYLSDVLRDAPAGPLQVAIGKNVDGIYTADPKKDPNAVKLDHITYERILREQGKL